MVSKITSVLAPAILMAAIASSGIQSAPVPAAAILQKKEVPSLTCVPVKVGTLSLYNTETKQTEYATFNNGYTLKDYFKGKNVPKQDVENENQSLLSSDSSITKDQALFTFSNCYPNLEGFPAKAFPPENNGTFYGHLSPVQSTNKQCATHLSVFADTNFLALEDCYFSYDSGAQFSTFSYTPSKDGLIQYVDNSFPYQTTQEYSEQRGEQYTFTPGESTQEPAVYVHDGDPKFSNWVLQLN